MAEMKSDLASELHGKVGDKLYRTLATGKIVVTPPSKAPTFIDEKDKDDRDTRMKGYGGSGHFAAVVNDAIKIGFPREKRGEQPLGKFMYYNAKTLCTSQKKRERRTGKSVRFQKDDRGRRESSPGKRDRGIRQGNRGFYLHAGSRLA